MNDEGTGIRRFGVRFVKNLLIPTRDGTRLAADLHLPEGDGPFPLILEYLPYRKDDQVPYSGYHHYFARHGYIGCRVDIRGTGASEGITTDEYVLQEQLDGYDVIEWLAQQPWCDGQIALFGFSYGGFVCYQVATHQPPHLKAIIPCYATDDRYTDDCHYRGGLFRHYYDFASYGAMMIAMNALPPYPEYSGADWARIWEQHLEHNVPYMLAWIEQQVDGPYWRPGSLRGQYEKVQCPTFIIGGWRDGYPNPPLRTYAQLKDRVPTRVLIGPWNHTPPDAAVPGPCIDYLHEIVRWLDYHFRGRDTGVAAEPPVQVYMQRYDVPWPDRLESRGEWRGEASWPPLDARERTLWLGPQGWLADAESREQGEEYDAYTYNPAVGLAGGLWSGGVPFGLPADQRRDEAFSLVYTSEPLAEEVAMLGWPRALLYVSSTAEVMGFNASLCDVAPDGTAALIAKGIVNATRRESLTAPLAQDRQVVRVQLRSVELAEAGRSYAPDYGTLTEREALRATVDKLGLDRFDLVGWSYGGHVSLAFTLEYPQRVRTLTVIEPPAVWILRELGYDPDALGRGEARDRSLTGKQVSLEDLNEFLVWAGLAEPGQDVASMASWPVWVRNRQVLSVNGVIWDYSDSVERLRALEVPVLAVKGTATAAHFAAIVDILVATVPHGRALELAGGHACHIQNRDRFLAELVRQTAVAAV